MHTHKHSLRCTRTLTSTNMYMRTHTHTRTHVRTHTRTLRSLRGHRPHCRCHCIAVDLSLSPSCRAHLWPTSTACRAPSGKHCTTRMHARVYMCVCVCVYVSCVDSLPILNSILLGTRQVLPFKSFFSESSLST
jgi:hypothetical protein